MRPDFLLASAARSRRTGHASEVNPAPRSKTFSEPTSRKAGSREQALGVVDILVPCQPSVYRLPHEVGQRIVLPIHLAESREKAMRQARDWGSEYMPEFGVSTTGLAQEARASSNSARTN